MPDPVSAAEVIHTSRSAAIREAAALFHDRKYQRVLGKAIGTGVGAGLLARRFPTLGGPIALLAGIYVGLELAAYLADASDPASAAIDAVAADAPMKLQNPRQSVTEVTEGGEQ